MIKRIFNRTSAQERKKSFLTAENAEGAERTRPLFSVLGVKSMLVYSQCFPRLMRFVGFLDAMASLRPLRSLRLNISSYRPAF